MLKSKIHRATLTGTVLDYEGSIALDRRLMGAADLLPGEQVHVLNVNTGSRLITYVIEAPAGSGTVMLNGPAARLGETGDIVIVLAFGHYEDAAARQLRPKIVHVNARNALVNRSTNRWHEKKSGPPKGKSPVTEKDIRRVVSGQPNLWRKKQRILKRRTD
jgi:aspartate 1-decarboxylase